MRNCGTRETCRNGQLRHGESRWRAAGRPRPGRPAWDAADRGLLACGAQGVVAFGGTQHARGTTVRARGPAGGVGAAGDRSHSRDHGRRRHRPRGFLTCRPWAPQPPAGPTRPAGSGWRDNGADDLVGERLPLGVPDRPQPGITGPAGSRSGATGTASSARPGRLSPSRPAGLGHQGRVKRPDGGCADAEHGEALGHRVPAPD
jgi:hypothetical protein